MSDDLVKRLREKAFRTETYELVNAAADRIEKLDAALREIRKTYVADKNRLIHGDQSIIKIIDHARERKND